MQHSGLHSRPQGRGRRRTRNAVRGAPADPADGQDSAGARFMGLLRFVVVRDGFHVRDPRCRPVGPGNDGALPPNPGCSLPAPPPGHGLRSSSWTGPFGMGVVAPRRGQTPSAPPPRPRTHEAVELDDGRYPRGRLDTSWPVAMRSLSPDLVGLDWGNFVLPGLTYSAGRGVDTRRRPGAPSGLMAVKRRATPADPTSVLITSSRIFAAAGLTSGRICRLIACGMAGSRQGWVEAPYPAAFPG